MTVEQLTAEVQRLQKIVDTVDDFLVVNWCYPGRDGDYRLALNRLMQWAVAIEDSHKNLSNFQEVPDGGSNS